MSRRREILEEALMAGLKDPFAWFALGIEYAEERRFDDAIQLLGRLREMAPTYMPMYQVAAAIHHFRGNKKDCLDWITGGLAVSKDAPEGYAREVADLKQALAEVGA